MKIDKRYLEYAVVIIPLALAILCVLMPSHDLRQARQPVPMPYVFVGEYSYDGENWQTLTDSSDISALDGDLTLRGHFDIVSMKDTLIRYYRNHIGVRISLNGEIIFMDEIMHMHESGGGMFAAMCGQEWCSVSSPGFTPQDTLEIRLHNPHRFGNGSAYRDFLKTICADVPNLAAFTAAIEGYGEVFRILGALCVVVSMMIMGAAAAAMLEHVQIRSILFTQSLLTLFAGGYIAFDTLDASLWIDMVKINTNMKLLCMMLAALFMQQLVSEHMTGRRRAIAKLSLVAVSLIDAALIALAVFKVTLLYDMLPWWVLSQMVICPLYVCLCALEIRCAPGRWNLTLVSGIVMGVAILLDIFGVAGNMVLRSPVSKTAFMLTLVMHLFEAARNIVVNHRATIRAEKLEKELENSRISIMLSQIQPHFLYNVLATIRGLCREEPKQAWLALGDFSDYLRGNMNALSNSRMIHFTSEFRHIETYLRLEKMRMRDKLNILYDIQEKNFFIPPLTIQPLVENAVKHGIFEKGSGTLVLHTHREGDDIVISVEDDGIGFDQNAPLEYDAHHAHVGLPNVRARLERMSGGKLTIDSAPGKGTVITVVLAADTMNDGGNTNEHTGC